MQELNYVLKLVSTAFNFHWLCRLVDVMYNQLAASRVVTLTQGTSREGNRKGLEEHCEVWQEILQEGELRRWRYLLRLQWAEPGSHPDTRVSFKAMNISVNDIFGGMRITTRPVLHVMGIGFESEEWAVFSSFSHTCLHHSKVRDKWLVYQYILIILMAVYY